MPWRQLQRAEEVRAVEHLRHSRHSVEEHVNDVVDHRWGRQVLRPADVLVTMQRAQTYSGQMRPPLKLGLGSGTRDGRRLSLASLGDPFRLTEFEGYVLG